MVRPPTIVDPPIPIDRTPQQRCSDWDYLAHMAKRHGYVTYIEPGPAPFTNQLYWGPPNRTGPSQSPLNVNLGPITNVSHAVISHNGLASELVETKVKDRLTGEEIPIVAIVPTRPPLGLVPEVLSNAGKLRTKPLTTSGLNAMQATARALAELDLSADAAVSIAGTLDSVRYNDVLRARAKVDVRGVGFTFNGTYRRAQRHAPHRPRTLRTGVRARAQ